MNEKFKAFVDKVRKNVVYYGVITMVSVVYTIASYIILAPTGKSIWSIVADGFLCFVVGLMINNACDIQGIVEGDRNPTVIETELKHTLLVDKIAPKIDTLEDWCNEMNKKAAKQQRVRILAEASIKYADYFDDEGNLIGEFKVNDNLLKHKLTRKHELKRVKCFCKCLNLKMTKLTAASLTSEDSNGDDPFNFGRSKKEYILENEKKDVVTKIVMAVIFGLFSPVLAGGYNVAMLIYKILQVCIFIGLGLIRKTKSNQYMLGEYVSRLRSKSHYLDLFYNDCFDNKIKEAQLTDGTEKQVG